jgi:hypothetical protein
MDPYLLNVLSDQNDFILGENVKKIFKGAIINGTRLE